MPIEKRTAKAAMETEAAPAKSATNLSTLPQEFIKAEKNLETLGFFTPSSRQTRKKAVEKVISFTTTVDSKRVKASATIFPSAKYGLPDTSDLDKYRAFQKILSDELIRNKRVPKHITFTSMDLIEAMGKNRKGGEIYKEIEDWLDRMVLTGIKSKGAVWLSGKNRWATDTFHVFERVVAYGQQLDDGTIAVCHHVWLSEWQLDNINGFWLLSLDYDLHKQLRKPIAKSLLPLLQIGFYASGGTYTKRYDELCQFLGIKKHEKPSYIKRQLEPSFKELQETGFLAKWDYDKNKIYNTYNITWQAGERFYEAQELLRERERQLTAPTTTKPKRITKPKRKSDKSQQLVVQAEALSEPEVLESAPVPQKEPSTSDKQLTQEQANLVEKLVELNVTKSVAEDLVGYFNNEFIATWTEAIHYADAQDKAAYLVKAIRESWLLPEKWITAKEQKGKQAEVEAHRQAEADRKEEAKRKQKEETERLEQIYNSLSPEQQAEVDEESQSRLPFFAIDRIREGQTDSPVVIASLKSAQEAVIKEWLESGKISVE